MPASSKGQLPPQATTQKPSSTTNAVKKDHPRSVNGSKASSKPVSRVEVVKPKAGGTVDTANQSKQPPTSNHSANDTATDATATATAGGVNRKKQKRRQKQAARLAAEQRLSNGYVSGEAVNHNGHLDYARGENGLELLEHAIADAGYPDPDFGDPEQYVEGEDLYYTDDEGRLYRNPHTRQAAANGTSSEWRPGESSKKSKKKKKTKGSAESQDPSQNHLGGSSTSSLAHPPPPPPPPLSTAALRATHKISRDRIWNTSTAEERERIKDFWLSLGEDDRRSLVKVEKEAVLRKMKEQQKHSCSCTVCGRKRTAIEEELEVLYDAYYEELEQYANRNQGFGDGAPIMPPPRMYHNPLPKATSDRMTHLVNTQLPSRGKVTEPSDEEDGDDEDYEDDEDDVDYSDDDLDEEIPPATDFFTFGNSLTVREGILTVADDLLKNDGRKFIDMMEQLAERRMQREEETQYAASALAHQSLHAGHNHGPQLDDDEFDDEDDEDDYSEDDEYEDDEMEAMTEEQRMEEGRRMFQIFAARMFEQRVLTAYREKVARERQQKLIEELEEESRLDNAREAKKAREAQKKKDKRKAQKAQKEEKKAKEEAEKAAEEAAKKAAEDKKKEEERQRKEEQRRKKEAERKAQDEEKSRKEAIKQRRLQEERDRQADAERKRKEQNDREKRKKEEAKRGREEREAKDRELREKKVQEERERKVREDQARKEKEAAAKAEREAKERARREELAAHQHTQSAANAKRAAQPGAIHLPPGLHLPQGPSNLQSPHFQIATPVIPKAPTPVRQRQSSQQGSHASSPRSQQALTESSHSASPGNPVLTQGSIPPTPASGKSQGSQPPLMHPQPSAPMSPIRGQMGRGGSSAFSFDGMPITNPPMAPGMAPRAPLGHDPPGYQHPPLAVGGQYRSYPPQNGVPMPPGMNGSRAIPQGRGFPLEHNSGFPVHSQSPTATAIAAPHNPPPREPIRSLPHSRQQSASYEKVVAEGGNIVPTQPIGRPAPVQRQPNTASNERAAKENSRPIRSEMDNLSAQLGSSALLEDTDIPLTASMTDNMHANAPPGAPGSGRIGFGASPLFPDPMGSSKIENPSIGSHGGHAGTWNSQLPFGAPGLTGAATWGNTPGWTATNNAFGIIGGPHRPHAARAVTIRLMVSQACRKLTANTSTKSGNGFHNVNAVRRQVDQIRPPNEPPVSIEEMIDIFDTEGNMQNGGGSFLVKDDSRGNTYVKFEPDNTAIPTAGGRAGVAPGDIGSPVPGSSIPFGGAGVGSRPPFQSSPPTGF